MDDSNGVIPYGVVICSNLAASGMVYTGSNTINADWRCRVSVRIPKALIKYPKLFKSDSILGELYRKHLCALMDDTEEVYPDEI